MMCRRARWAALLTVVATCGLAGTAHADPPGPTDYRSRVESMAPSVVGVSARIIGGDSFFQLTLDPSANVDELVVVGYRGEPYLRFLRGGEVDENQRSPSRFLNLSRYGTATEPAGADPAAAPVWRAVAHDGRWAWHDHRTHWMNTVHPPGRHPGDQILEAVIPLVVDGDPVAVTVTSTWMPAPSGLPAVLGAVVGLTFGIGALAVARGRARRDSATASNPLGHAAPAAALFAAAAIALVVGLWQTWSVPAQTGPPVTAWALPLTALVVAAGGLARRWSTFTVHAIAIVGAAQLVLWAVLRREGLVRAILPTNAPFWFDRATSAGTGVAAAVVGAGALIALGRMLIRPVGQPSASM